jgi:hypothetical protein
MDLTADDISTQTKDFGVVISFIRIGLPKTMTSVADSAAAHIRQRQRRQRSASALGVLDPAVADEYDPLRAVDDSHALRRRVDDASTGLYAMARGNPNALSAIRGNAAPSTAGR